MNDNHTHQSINRSEFSAAMRHIEALLGQQTMILQTLAVAAVENRGRDEKAAALALKVADVQKEQAEMKQKFMFLTGVGAVLMAVWPALAKKLGFT